MQLRYGALAHAIMAVILEIQLVP